jgi:hypothetical protein
MHDLSNEYFPCSVLTRYDITSMFVSDVPIFMSRSDIIDAQNLIPPITYSKPILFSIQIDVIFFVYLFCAIDAIVTGKPTLIYEDFKMLLRVVGNKRHSRKLYDTLTDKLFEIAVIVDVL